MSKLKVLIAGSTGYIGIQLITLLCKHKNVEIKYLCGNSSVGQNISYYSKKLKKKKLPKIIKFKKELLYNVDLIFTALPNVEAQELSKYLIKNGLNVVNYLSDGDFDIILIINPLKSSEMSTFNHLDAYYYKQYVNKESIILQRINECDERKKYN